jgi:lipase chaperone LimK
MSFHKNIEKLRDQTETSRVGVKWTEEEDESLMDDIHKKLDINDIAKKHQRTAVGIKCRILGNSLRIMEEENISFEDVSELFHLDIEELKNYKLKQEQKAEARKNKNTLKEKSPKVSNEELMSVLLEIRNYLKIIAEKKS